jgi:hypothetical protein
MPSENTRPHPLCEKVIGNPTTQDVQESPMLRAMHEALFRGKEGACARKISRLWFAQDVKTLMPGEAHVNDTCVAWIGQAWNRAFLDDTTHAQRRPRLRAIGLG